MNKKSAVIIVAANFLTASALAGTMGPVTQQSDWTWVGSFSAGPVWENGGSTQTFYLTPEIEKSYVANRSTNTLFDGEVFLGMQKIFSQTLQGQLGVAVAATSNANLSGVIWDDADSQFDNFTYRYTIQHTHVAVKGKLLVDKGYWLIPWISASLGVGFNNARSFNGEPIIFEAVETPDFASHTQTSFTYTLGAGVQKALNQHWQVGVGYEFADWGKSQLGRAREQTQNSGLTLNHLYTNGILFNLTYLA
ncbi:outer membrane protein [Legionella sp. km772]|uniref:outer membrane protein n=1 Tax=Legionella sp. km772 TaxID=2498111 RepID=UPI000F8D9382|nr:porin family protein [Legionella sp. km772]RUR08544.1 porin family protein [Legionella sp. km772]